ncbi:unnamed protein product [Spirodela intermedia]|uniref:Uncharacterized protein n=1 Tax=Spirodela intermedia TaxID=51605 RepID=A0A7I8KW16_SPIIN|nr:unnamed protein product [Spirodela intermedia]
MKWVAESSPAAVTRRSGKMATLQSFAAVTRRRGARWRWGASTLVAMLCESR